MRSRVLYYHPESLTPPHRVVRTFQVLELAADMCMVGWQGQELIGYDDAGGIQLLSGTHRRAAASLACVLVPVRVYPSSLVARCWGRLARWTALMQGRL